MTRAIRRMSFLTLMVLVPIAVQAQEAPPANPPAGTAAGDKEKQEKEARSIGLPTNIVWTFNLDAGWGTFGFANSLFNNPKEPGVNEDLSDQWFEGFVKPALSGSYQYQSSELYGKLSFVGERTYGSIPAEFGQDISSFGPEDLYIGWRSGKTLAGLGENAVDISVGRKQYRLGHGFLLFDGAAEGGSRGGYWTNARKAFEFAAIGSIKPGHHLIETFYLDKDELEENDSGSRLWGANYEYEFNEATTVGATYMKWFADPDIRPGRDGLNVFNVRAYAAPIKREPGLVFEFEYASENNGEELDSNAWTLQAGYEFAKVMWKPTLTYRYASFEGDDPDTASNEAFDPLFLGFYDWGTWWQGEIAGEYFLSNSNLNSHLIRVHFSPSDAVGGGLMFFKFSADQPASVAPGVTDSDLALEIDAYVDWKLNRNFTISFLGAYGDPGKAVQQASGRTKNFAYGMAYIAYSF
jgi:hypothetical protein